ncbi:PDZ and LIM domain protein 3 [Mactra antiquata]
MLELLIPTEDGVISMTLVQVKLARDCMQTPWGFRLQGGKDIKQPLVVQRVFANTPSERELQRGDAIVAINGRDTSNLTHKQAQDAISGGGGQIELLVQRPTGAVHIKPLTPAPDTRAPTFPTSPTRAPQINIPIQRKSGPPSPTRVIPVSPQKPTPPAKAPKPTQRGTDTTDMSSGFMPTKITMNKYGGGGPNYGSQYGGPSSPQRAQPSQYRPVAAPVPAQQQFQPQSQNQFSAPQQEERGVEEEQYGGVSERRRQFLKGAPQPPTIQRSRKPVPNFGRAGQSAESQYMNFGVDYTKPQPPPQQPKQFSSRPRPPPVNRRDDDDLDGQPWSNTLKGESKLLKPWEREALEAERYQSGTVDQPYRPYTDSPPKPRITQISAQSTARPAESQLSPAAGYRSVSPSVPPKPNRSSVSPAYQSPSLQQLSPYANNDVSGGGRGQEGAPNIVHLQYNSPMGLYSKDNVMDTYVGQTQGRAQSSGQQKKPAAPGERDWNDSFVYQMIHSSEKTTTSSRQDAPGQPPQGETVTTTRVTQESKFPGQEPQRTVTETVQRGGAPDYKFDSAIGISDF